MPTINDSYVKVGAIAADAAYHGTAKIYDGIPPQVKELFARPGIEPHLYTFGPGVPILGPELVPSDVLTNLARWSVSGCSASSVGGAMVFTATGAGTMTAILAASMPSGQFRATHRVSQKSVSSVARYIRGATVGNSTSVSVTESTSQSSNTSEIAGFQMAATAAGQTFTVDALSVSLILGHTNTYSGFVAGNYFDSAGATHASIDGSVGLVLGGAGSVGPELVNSAAWTLAQPTSGSVTNVAGTIAINSADGTYAAARQGASEINATYRFSGTASGLSGGGVAVSIGAASYVPAAGPFSCVLVAPSISPFEVKRANGVGAGTIVGLTVTKVTGIHATQSTPGFKPTLRKGIVNQTYYSSDLSNAAWTKAGSPTVAVGSLARTSTGATYLAGSSAAKVATSLPFTQAGVFSANTGRYAVLRLQGTYPNYVEGVFDLQTGVVTSSALNGTFTNKAASIVQVEAGKYLCVVSATTDTALVAQPHISVNSNATALDGTDSSTTSSMGHYGSATFAGTLTASQIIAAGGIPLTTTAPASSSAGVNYLEFDGVDDRLTLSAPLFQMSDDHCVIAGAAYFGTALQNNVIASPSQAASLTRAGQIAYDSTVGSIQCSWYDGTNYDNLLHPYPASTPFLATALKRGTVLKQRVNGIDRNTKTATANPVGTNGSIGAYFDSSSAFKGRVFPVLVIKGTVSDADLLVLEKFVAQLSGVTL